MTVFDIEQSTAVFCCWAHTDEIAWALRNYTPASPVNRHTNARQPAPAKRALLLGVPPSLPFNQFSGQSSRDRIALTGYVPESLSQVTAGEHKGALIFVDRSALGVAALAKVLGYEWQTQQKDLKILAGLTGPDPATLDSVALSMFVTSTSLLLGDDNALSPEGALLSTIFSKFPNFDAQTSCENETELVAVVRLFLATLGDEANPARLTAIRELDDWIADKSRMSA